MTVSPQPLRRCHVELGGQFTDLAGAEQPDASTTVVAAAAAAAVATGAFRALKHPQLPR